MNILILQFLLGIIFLTLIFLHLTKKNLNAIFAYAIQSSVILVLLLNSFFEAGNIYIFAIILLTLAVKVILTPIFFKRLIKKHAIVFSASTYFNTPLVLVIIAALTFMAHSNKIATLTGIIPANQALLSLALSSVFISLFLIINRKGALSQVLGILSLENSIVAFIIFAGLEQSPGLQAGVIFNIAIWIVIAKVFMSMMYGHFGSQDVTSMNNLKD